MHADCHVFQRRTNDITYLSAQKIRRPQPEFIKIYYWHVRAVNRGEGGRSLTAIQGRGRGERARVKTLYTKKSLGQGSTSAHRRLAGGGLKMSALIPVRIIDKSSIDVRFFLNFILFKAYIRGNEHIR